MSTTYRPDGTERASLRCTRLGWHKWRRFPVLGGVPGLTWVTACTRCDLPLTGLRGVAE